MRWRLVPALLVAALAVAAPQARACEPFDDLAAAVTAARAELQEARAAFAARGDVGGPLDEARSVVRTARSLALSIVGPGDLASSARRARRALSTASTAMTRADRARSRRRVRTLLGVAGRSLGRAQSIVDAAPAADTCSTVALNGRLTDVLVFPADNWWNTDVSALSAAENSDATIDFIGRDKPLHADFGTTFGIPYVVLEGAHRLVSPTFGYADESDVGAPGGPTGYPIPDLAKSVAGTIEGGVAGGGTDGDRHLLLVDRTSNLLYELYAARWTGERWVAGSGAVFDLTSNARRPEGWTSADAAGLAILPGLVRADEVFEQGEIRHALRFTVRATEGYIFPASHDATHGAGGDLRPPLGLRVRLKDGVDLSTFSAPARVVLTAMKRYGMILADNGSDWFVTGSPDPRWDDERMHDDFAQITGDDFEVVE